MISERIETPVAYKADVLVAGGGIAGIAAAIAAARSGVHVTLLERSFMLGGLATAGLVTIYLPLCDGEGTQVSFGLAEELFRLSMEHGAEARYPTPWLEGGSLEERRKTRYEVQFNAQLFAISCERVLRESGVRILYGATAVAVTERDGRIDHVIIESKSGREAIAVSRCVVDTTGDADICHLSSAKTALHGYDNALAGWYYYFTAGEYKLKMYGYAPSALRNNPSLRIGPIGKSGYDGTSVLGVTDFMLDSHAAIEADVLARRAAGEADLVPTTIATTPQFRMTRRLDGMYTLDEAEVKKHFDDSIGMVSDWRRRGPVFEIPFGTLRGKEVKNLLTAGRCISVADNMWDITRVIPDCAVTGEAAGIAAAMTDDLDTLDVTALQRELVARGVKLHLEDVFK